ncbi:MAG: hypothetical protein ABIO64_04085 [Burkholderiaceae bacterium]
MTHSFMPQCNIYIFPIEILLLLKMLGIAFLMAVSTLRMHGRCPESARFGNIRSESVTALKCDGKNTTPIHENESCPGGALYKEPQ